MAARNAIVARAFFDHQAKMTPLTIENSARVTFSAMSGDVPDTVAIRHASASTDTAPGG